MSEKSKFDIVSDLALRRGIYFPSAEIYSDTPAGFWDYGPLGVALKRRIIELWRQTIVKRDEMLEIDGSQILPESVFEASGHLQSFVDPLVECKACGVVFRADRLIQSKLEKLIPEALPSKELDRLISQNRIVCPECEGDLSNVYKFNMMFRFAAGPRLGNHVALRPETCQSIFLDFLRVYKAMRVKLPIGLAQVGKSFRNEISPRRNLIRLRELTQAEIEVFFNPKKMAFFPKFDAVKDVILTFSLINDQEMRVSAEKAVTEKIVQNKLVAYYLVLLKEFYEFLGIQAQDIRYREWVG
jgi:glycyl-tRNA synthetase